MIGHIYDLIMCMKFKAHELISDSELDVNDQNKGESDFVLIDFVTNIEFFLSVLNPKILTSSNFI